MPLHGSKDIRNHCPDTKLAMGLHCITNQSIIRWSMIIPIHSQWAKINDTMGICSDEGS